MKARFIRATSADLHVETFGRIEDEPLLLVAGATNCMHWWADDLCSSLADAGRFVVRYDHRDTGHSTCCATGALDYGFDELVTDAGAVAASLGLDRLHLVGISMGGAIAQRIAIDTASAVASLTLISTSPGSAPGRRIYPDLPPVSERLRSPATTPTPSGSCPSSTLVDQVIATQALLSGPVASAESEVRELAELVAHEPARDAALANHPRLRPGREYRHRLSQITAPTLVIHGTEDPLYPFGHAQSLAREIPNASLVPLAGVGHHYPPRQTWAMVIPRLIQHTGAA